jgi:Fur family ferric uptake transcriptional regulator
MAPKLTPLRKEILALIEREERPLNAKHIMQRVHLHPNLSSIYRSCEYLVTRHLLQSVSFSGVRHYFLAKRGRGHFIICKGCNEIITFDECIAEALQKRVQDKYDYTITDHVLYFEGFCPDCKTHYVKRAHTKNK